MSRFILSNNENVVKGFTILCQEQSFRDNVFHTYKGHVVGSTFKKKCIEHNNVYNDGENFIACVGTYFYKGVLGGGALPMIYNDFVSGVDLAAIRESIHGNYSLVIVIDGKLWACSDALGVYYLLYYYNVDTNDWMIGTSMFEMAKVCPYDLTYGEFNLIEECYSKAIYGEDTIINEFKKVTGDNYLCVELSTNALEVLNFKSHPFVVDSRPVDVIVDEVVSELKSIADEIKQNLGENGTAICMTGGLDARVTLATLLNRNLRPHLYYGVGNSCLTNTKVGDLDVDKMYAEKLGLPLQIMDYRDTVRIDKYWDKYIDKDGFYDHFSSVTPSLKDSFESIGEPLVFWNFFGELFRNVDIVEDSNADEITIEDIVERHYINPRNMKPMLGDDYEQYKNHIAEKIRKSLTPYLTEHGTLPMAYFTVYDFYRRINCDTHKMNQCNQHRYSMSLLGQPKLMRYITMPINNRRNAIIIIKIIEGLYGHLLDFPVFSHCNFRAYDRTEGRVSITKVMSRIELPKVSFVKKGSKIKQTIIWKSARCLVRYCKNPKQIVVDYKILQRDIIPKKLVAWQIRRIIDRSSLFDRNVDPMISDYIPKDAHLALMLEIYKKLKVNKLTSN